MDENKRQPPPAPSWELGYALGLSILMIVAGAVFLWVAIAIEQSPALQVLAGATGAVALFSGLGISVGWFRARQRTK